MGVYTLESSYLECTSGTKYRVRVVVTINGQTAEVTSGTTTI